VIERSECIEVLKGTPDCELGTHLHGDVVEPERTIIDMRDCRIKEMQCSYSRQLENDKLCNITEKFRRAFGASPRSFRAGRFGAGNNTIPCLEELGYLVDTSVTPFVIWDYDEGRADFRKAIDRPYFPSHDDITREGRSKVLEVPVSIVPLPFHSIMSRVNHGINRALPPIPEIFYQIWISPSNTDPFFVKYGINKILRKNGGSKVIVVNLMFHSMEVMPGASPISANEAQARAFLRRTESILDFCKEKGFQFTTLSEVYPFLKKAC
jgi:hypothetical protein